MARDAATEDSLVLDVKEEVLHKEDDLKDDDLETPLIINQVLKAQKEYDMLRDGPLRYLGYANEVGEAFEAWVPFSVYVGSYVVALLYCVWDMLDKFWRTYRTARILRQELATTLPPSALSGLPLLLASFRGFDTLLWQLLASVIIPGYVTHVAVALAALLLHLLETWRLAKAALIHTADELRLNEEIFVNTFNRSVPTIVGLLVIPIIVKPIDNTVHAILNATTRPLMRWLVAKKVGSAEAGSEICKACKL